MAKKSSKNAKEEKFIQPEINLGLVGHVDHGKTTLTKALSGVWTDTHSEELKRGITIRLGYANMEVRKTSDNNLTVDKKDSFGVDTELVRKISLVDAPGHESLMATLLAGTTIMDGALLLVSADDDCPQAQTAEHLQALEISGIDKIIVIQNKVDMVPEEDCKNNYNQIKEFLKGTKYEDSPIVPIAARFGLNMDLLLETIQDYFPTPKRDDSKDARFLVARTFDINKPGTRPGNLKGGVFGGVLKQGRLSVGDDIVLTPGKIVIEQNQTSWKPIKTKITNIMTGDAPVNTIVPGGSVAIMTELDPAIVKGDALKGNTLSHTDEVPQVWTKIKLDVHLMKRIISNQGEIKVNNIAKGEHLLMNVNSAATVGIVTDVSKKGTVFELRIPIAAEKGQKISLSRQIGNRFRLIGYGEIIE
ncbi:MAG: translation initiation factor IF-2 subunit gamma [Nanobdellota archaeon]